MARKRATTEPNLEVDPGADAPLAGDEEAEAAALAAAFKQLDAAAESGSGQDLIDFVDRRFRGIDPHTYTEFLGAAEVFLGQEAAAFLTRLAAFDPDDRPAEIDHANLTPAATRFVARFVALYGTELARAWSLWYRRRLGDDWSGVRRDIFRDVETGEIRILLQIRKKNGDLVDFEMPPQSILNLVGGLIHTLTRIGDASALPEEDLRAFMDAISRFTEVFIEASRGPTDQPQQSAD